MELNESCILNAAMKYPLPEGFRLSYGTAGFRTDASLLDSTAFRTGILAALRSLYTGSTIGLMITASHNPVKDNGVKIADPGGDMLSQDWEPFAEALANAKDPQHLVEVIFDFVRKNLTFETQSSGRVYLARDTRPSGERLLNAAVEGVKAVPRVTSVVLDILTTPQLHWMVRATNRGLPADELDYFTQLSEGFKRLCTDTKLGDGFIIDAANGVGANKLFQLKKLIPELQLEIRNGSENEGLLNDHVGADFVQKEKTFPRNFGDLNDLGRRCASLDGDADRIVFFYSKNCNGGAKTSLQLIDGDKILTLFAIFIQKQIQELYDGIDHATKKLFPSIKLGVVQTAYANGASTRFLKESLGINVVFTPTGVKHLHHKATEYDIGIYFEANGHGTVLFKEEFLQLLTTTFSHGMNSNTYTTESWTAAQRLLAVSQVINQAIGDALSVLLLVEAILVNLGWSLQEWDNVYTDLPSKQTKVKVKDRSLIKTTNAETTVIHPDGLQNAINNAVEKIRSGRAFVRPSGTEDIVRVYAEAETQTEADALAKTVGAHVFDFANGIDS